MGHAKDKYLTKLRQQRINRNENRAYYQNGGEWKDPASEQKRQDRRKLED